MTDAEADMHAAGIVLELCGRVRDRGDLAPALGRIEHWLRRRACGGDKIAIRQLERELGHQVRMKGK